MRAEDYVHEYHDAHGRRRFVVAEYRDGRYYAPQREDVAKLTGAHTIFGPLGYVLGNAYHYARRADAVARAGELYNLTPEEECST